MAEPDPGAGPGPRPRRRDARSTPSTATSAAASCAARSVELPHTPGLDVAGTVDALGEGVDGLAVGDRVVGFLPMDKDGAAAEYVLAPADVLTAAPKDVPLADAAALPLVALTAYQALFEHGKLAAGQRVLINGAGGAVGGYAVQLAKEAGAHVIATASPRSARRGQVRRAPTRSSTTPPPR